MSRGVRPSFDRACLARTSSTPGAVAVISTPAARSMACRAALVEARVITRTDPPTPVGPTGGR